MAARVSSAAFIGRRPELERLEAAMGAAAAGRPSLVLVLGDAGVGKTRLVSEFATRARTEGCLVLSGGCLPVGEAGLPFAAVVEALRGAMRTLGRAGFEALAGPARGELARLVPDLGSAVSPAGTPTADGWGQARLFELLLGFIGRLAARSPVAVVVEDLHWADEATRALVAYLVHNLAEERVLLVGTVRADDLHRRHPLMPLLAELRRSSRVERIDLPPFGRDDLSEQLAGILGRQPEPSLVAEIDERSGGNAYLAEELVAVGPSARLPETVEDVLLARVERLGPAAQDLLRVASAAGPRIDPELLATVASGVVGDPLSSIHEALDEHLLVRLPDDQAGERFGFRHALLQEAVYGRLLAGERSRYHEAYARALSERPAPLDPSTAAELAHHWEAADDLPRALAASVEAARAAADIYAFADAQRLLERAVALWERVPDAAERAGMDRAALLERTAAAAATAGSWTRAAVHARAAIELVDEATEPVRAGLLYERLARYTFKEGESAQALTASREAVRLVPAEPPTSERGLVLARLAQSLGVMGAFEAANAADREAIAIARAIGSRAIEAEALQTLSMGLLLVGPIDEAVSAIRRARDIAMEIADDSLVLDTWRFLLVQLDIFAEEEACAVEAAAAVAWAHERGRDRSAAGIILLGVYALYQLARWDEAWQMLDLARSVAPEGRDRLLLHVAGAELAIGRGDLEAAARSLDAHRPFIRPENTFAPLSTGDLTARLALARGDLREARRRVEQGLVALTRLDRGDANIGCYVLLTALSVEAELAERARARGAQGDLDKATAHGRAVIEQAHAVIAWILAGFPELRRRPAAVLALCDAEWSRLQGESSPTPWEAAAAACEAGSQLHLRPYALYRQAEAMLAGKADRAGAAELLRSAHAAVVAMGARPLQRDIERLAERARIRLGAVPSGDEYHPPEPAGSGLTPRELEVLTLVATGRTNRQIAEELFISEKTAGVHVSNILGKLGASGRTEAAAIAHRLRLVE